MIPTSAPQPPARRPRRRILLGLLAGVLALAAAAALTVVLTSQGADREPDAVVHDFLTAIAEREVDLALDIAQVAERPNGEAARFLDPDALGDPWEILEVTETRRTEHTAVVRVRLSDPDTRPEFELIHDDERGWRIRDPLIHVRVEASALWYVDLNGMVVPREPYDEEAAEQAYLLLPGTYDLYPSAADLVTVEPDTLTLLPDEPTVVAAPALMLTDKGEQLVEQTAHGHLDRCARSRELRPPGCQFGARDIVEADNVLHEAIDDVSWKITRYPNIVPLLVGESFTFTADDGTVELSGTGVDSSAERVPFTTECPFFLSGYGVGFTADGELTLHDVHRKIPDQLPETKTHCS